MENVLSDSKAVSKKHKDQRDSARLERDIALDQRDSARTERDSFINKTETLEKDKIIQEQFIATLSHDLRNPIGAIKMAANLMREDPDPRLGREMIDLIDRNADQAGELITQLLDAHLIRSGERLPLNIERCNLLQLVQKCCDSLPPQHKSKIVFEFSGNESWGFWDAQALERAFKNIINNALKFSYADRDILVKVSSGSDSTRIIFRNFGEVIPPENLPHIFDGYVKGSPNRARSKAGWGLGLTLVRGIVEAHRGKVKVSSSEAEGTKFSIDLPNDSRDHGQRASNPAL